MKNTVRICGRVIAAALLMSSLGGCVALLAGGTVAGMVSASDRRTVGAQTDDKVIGLKAAKLARQNTLGTHINGTSFNRKLLLTGQAVDEATKSKIEAEAKAIPGVERVINEIEIGEIAGYKSRSNDTLVTTRVVASLLESKTTQANLLKVVTERGTVYLLGRVTKEESDAAVNIVRGVAGVTRVVKVFEYISSNK